MDVFTASLQSACSLRSGHFVNNLKATYLLAFLSRLSAGSSPGR
ncbi:gluconate 5-dehydrogenase [Yersinia pseudotuberculosis]